jgi:hypothetical protein
MLLSCIFGAATVAPAAAQEMPVPASLQAAILAKVLHYDRTLQEAKAPIHVLIAYKGTLPDFTGELIDGLESANVTAEAVEVSRLRDHLNDLSVVYLAPGVDPGALADAAKGKNVLFVTGVPSWVREGRAALGFDSKGGKPRLVVNQTRLRASGHQFSADMLRLAEIV